MGAESNRKEGNIEISKKVSPAVMREIFNGASNKAEGCARLYAFVKAGLEAKTFTADDVKYCDLALAMGVVDPYNQHDSVSIFAQEARNFNPEINPKHYFRESNPGLLTNSFQTITQELLSSVVIEGYTSDEGYIGDQLCQTVSSRTRNQKIPGVTSLDGPKEVAEGHPYEDTGFTDKYVTSEEYKRGRILSLSEELLLFDQTGLVNMRARELGAACRQDRERQIVRGVIDADSGAGRYVYRPKGIGEVLYDGTNQNLIGTGGVPNYTSAIALEDWTDINEVRVMRATAVVDDRVDGTPRPIPGLNGPQNVLLVPVSLDATAR